MTFINKCGDCTACCYTHNAGPVKPKLFTWCKHKTCSGCGIYEERPEGCQVYSCFWLQTGMTDLKLRPDTLGAVIDVTREFNTPLPVIMFWETETGDVENSIGVSRLISHFMDLQKYIVGVFTRNGNFKFLFPHGMTVEEIIKANRMFESFFGTRVVTAE